MPALLSVTAPQPNEKLRGVCRHCAALKNIAQQLEELQRNAGQLPDSLTDCNLRHACVLYPSEVWSVWQHDGGYHNLRRRRWPMYQAGWPEQAEMLRHRAGVRPSCWSDRNRTCAQASAANTPRRPVANASSRAGPAGYPGAQ